MQKDRIAKLIPFELYDITDFIVEHPVYHPLFEQDLYKDYWNEEVKRCLQGMWGYDYSDGKGGYRWMPGNLYFYVNNTEIKIEGDEGREVFSRPFLRDIEWLVFYALSECDGFSGFEGDSECSSYKPLGKLQSGEKVTNQDKILLEKYDKYLKKPDGTYKKYVNSKDLLYKTYDKPMDRPLYLNEMSNLVILSSRGVGKEQPHSEPVLTTKGWSTMGDIKVGDKVFGSDGKPCNVIDKFPQGEKEVYMITLSDGRQVRAGKDHLWKVFDRNKKGYFVETTEELMVGLKALPTVHKQSHEGDDIVLIPDADNTVITNVEKLPYKEESSCIMVDSEDNTYITKDYVVTHNSYTVSNGVILYDFVFGSSRTPQEFYSRSMPSVSVIGAFDTKYSSALIDKFQTSYERMRKSVGSFLEENVNSPFFQPFDGSIKKAGSFITNSTKEEGGRSYSGTGSQVWHVSYKDNPNAGVGFRARRMIVEEAGLLSNFKEVHSENSGTQRRETKIGYTIYIGTGGNIEKIKGIREAYYNPSAYECVEFKDVFTGKNSSIGLFIPSPYRSILYKTPQGNTMVKEAYEDEFSKRAEKKKKGSKAYDGYVVSFPIYPHEMFLQTSSNPFPSELVEERLNDLETGEWEKLAKPGELIYTDKEKTNIYFSPKTLSECSIIRRWKDEEGMSDSERAGTIVIYEHPSKFKPSLSYNRYMYLVAYDQVRDEDGGTSLACVQVWKFWEYDEPDAVQFNLVAEWLGRHIGTNGLEADHEVAFKLSTYYNAPILPEINIKDVLRYGRMTNRWYRFLPKPKLALEGMEINQRKDYPVGLYISPGMKPDLERYLNDALHTVVDRDHRIYGDKEMYNEVKMVSRIPSMRICEELLYYSRDDNFDSISTAMLWAVAKREKEETPVLEYRDREEDMASESLLNFFESPMEIDNNPAFNY